MELKRTFSVRFENEDFLLFSMNTLHRYPFPLSEVNEEAESLLAVTGKEAGVLRNRGRERIQFDLGR